MGILLRDESNRTELQKRIARDLAEKAKLCGDGPDKKPDVIDGVDDSAYIEGSKKTTSLAGVWLALLAIVVVLIVWLVVELV